LFLHDSIFSNNGASTKPGAVHINIDRGWKFAYGHASDADLDFGYGTRPFVFAKAGYGDGPAAVTFSDAGWRQVDVPHDWAVELPFDARGDTNHGSHAIGRRFPENSVGWYRKVLDIPAAAKGRRIALEFDGVYRNSVVWVNGHYMGTEPSGYAGFRYDITDYVNYGGPNVIAVRADASREEGWYYEGAGIYRHTWMTVTAPLHVAQWGTFVRPTVHGDTALVDVDVTVANDAKHGDTFTIQHEIVCADGRPAARATATGLRIGAAVSGTYAQHLTVRDPHLWSTDDPYLYRLTTRVRRGSDVVDQYEMAVVQTCSSTRMTTFVQHAQPSEQD
jgi:beta-galactosidase